MLKTYHKNAGLSCWNVRPPVRSATQEHIETARLLEVENVWVVEGGGKIINYNIWRDASQVAAPAILSLLEIMFEAFKLGEHDTVF